MKEQEEYNKLYSRIHEKVKKTILDLGGPYQCMKMTNEDLEKKKSQIRFQRIVNDEENIKPEIYFSVYNELKKFLPSEENS